MSGPVILVVDDDEDLRDAMAAILESAGYEAMCAANGREALAALDRQRPEAILLDMKMPVMNGWEFAEALRERADSSIPVVVVTAAEDARRRAAEIGADSWLAKPFDIDSLLKTVARYAPAPA